jgi:transposase
MRSIVRRDSGESYDEFLTGLAKESGIATPTREDLARVDRKRDKKTSNKDWVNPHDRDARVAKMKDGRTHLAHKAEHAVDMDSGAVVAVTLQPADQGDTTTVKQTLAEAGETVAELIEQEAVDTPDQAPRVHLGGIEELVGDKGYHSAAVLSEIKDAGVRTYIPERKQTGRRNWRGNQAQRRAVYDNRRRISGSYGKSLLRKRGELLERSFAHCYDTGGMRRTHLRGHPNILKRQLIHIGAFNLSLILRRLLGAGTPRELRNRARVVSAVLFWLATKLIGPLQASVVENRTFASQFSRRTHPRWRTRHGRNPRGSATDC